MMPNQPPLYLAALLPPPELAEREHAIKKEIAERFGTKVAVTRPAHITIIAPLRADDEKLAAFDAILQNQAAQTEPFQLQVNGFGHFGNKVVYLHVEPHPAANNLYQCLKQQLLQQELVSPKFFPHNTLNPHMTVAYRDLTPEMFRNIWEAYKDQEFKADFQADSLHLLRHEDKRWVKFREYGFGG